MSALRKIDQDLIGLDLGTMPCDWDWQDVALYALAVGATLDADFEFLYENGRQEVIPSFAIIPPTRVTPDTFRQIDMPLEKLLHGEQVVELHRPIPAAAKATVTRRVTDVWDKGKAAVIVFDDLIEDADGPIATSRICEWVTGAGGFGGHRGPSRSDRNAPPSRAPDHTILEAGFAERAALYRLCGDDNPIHIDPDFARKAGFEAPFLHGACTFGIVTRQLLQLLCDGSPARFRKFEARFSNLVLPSDELRTEVWLVGAGEAVVRVAARGETVLSAARVAFDPVPGRPDAGA
jgi:acyl dehydratase